MTMKDKKNTLANTGASNNQTHRQDTTPVGIFQQLENLPDEILAAPRFFQLRGNSKDATPKGWSNPDNQKFCGQLEGYVGFDTCGHLRGVDYLFLDFDHVLDDDGNWINVNANKCFRWILSKFKTYCELSQSGHGVHILAVPTEGKFKMYSGGNRGTVYFDGNNPDMKLEIFYRSKARYCLLTGNVYHCEAKTPIAHGEAVDGVFQALLDVIAERAKKTLKSAQVAKEIPKQTKIDSPDYDAFRAGVMLDCIVPADLPDTDWLAVISAAKNIGIAYPVVDAWNQQDPERYNESENLARWNSVTDTDFDIETLHGIAKRFGYSEKDTCREWFQLHPELTTKIIHRPAPMDDDDDGEVKFAMTQDKIKSCPVNLRLPDNYVFNRNGITLVVPPKKDGDNPKHICAARTPIVPTRKFREPVKGTLEYEFAILDSGKWRKVEIDGSALADTRDLSKTLARYGAQIKKGEHLREFFIDVLSLNPELRELKSYSQTGWTTDDYEEFAYPSSDGTAIIRRAGYDYERIFKPRGDRDAWKKKFLEIDKQAGAVGHVIIGGACSAPLIKPLEDLPNLQIHVHGKKSIGKTPMLKFAVSIFGDTDVGALTHTFAATPKSRLETACAFSDLPLICEELESIGAKDATKLSTDIYNFFLGIGGQALKKDGTKRDPKIFSSVRLTSGEHSLVQSCGNGGEFKRVLDLRCASLLDEDFASDLYGFCKRNHGLFGEQWINYVTKNWLLISKHYHRTFDAVKAMQVKGSENDLTQLRTLVISLVDYQHFKICIGLSDLSTDADKINAEINADINAIIAQLPTAAEIDDTTRAIEFLQSFYVANLKHFVREVDNPNFENEFMQGAIECYGKSFEDGEVAFLPHILKRTLTADGGFTSADKLIAEFRDKGYLRHRTGRKTYQTKIAGKNADTIRFYAGIIATAEEDTDVATATENDINT